MFSLKERIDIIRNRVEEAARRASRKPDDITLVAVSKNVEIPVLQQAAALGLDCFGENRVQEGVRKSALLTGVSWHLIGPLQTNKIKQAVKTFDFIHAADRLSILTLIAKEAAALNKKISVLLEVNISGEASKHGFTPEAAVEAVKQTYGLAGIEISGLMTMAPYVDDPNDIRYVFSGLRQLFEKIKSDFPRIQTWRYLSMGMSNDFEVAIEEGANLVRIGSAIFAQTREGRV